jgi:hypothetical protein
MLSSSLLGGGMSYCVVEDMMGVVNRVRLKGGVTVGLCFWRSEEKGM